MKKYIILAGFFLAMFPGQSWAAEFLVDSSSTLKTNLVAYYPYDGTSTDIFAAHNQIKIGSTTFSQGKVGQAVNFGSNNTGNRLRNTDSIGINGGAISISAWVNVTTAPSNQAYTFVDVDSGANNIGYYLEYADVGGAKSVYFGRDKLCVAVDLASATTTLATGTWYNLTGTFNGSLLSLYINGALQSTSTTAGGNGTCNQDEIETGSRNNGVTNKYSGLIDEVSIWRKALTPEDASYLYNGGSGQSLL
jgi:hypothetical protein